jgi:hypothetical protein
VSEITLVPPEFTLVKFDAGEVRDLIAAAIVDTGFRGETDENPIQLARKLRQMAGFSTDEIDELAEIALQAKADAEAMAAGAGGA